ncbi:hypothetical protein ABZ714_13770 [Streptomyces sp. NPDC006798]|uniref:hypothetical protein n=1 Tax=Streptomyces sp. NPDC006798 TaxID=3155462 RepID=UPI0034103427
MTHSAGAGGGDRGNGYGPGSGAQPPREGDPWIPDTPATGQPWGPPPPGAHIPLPPEQTPPGAMDATTFLPPVPTRGHPQGDADATTVLPPVPAPVPEDPPTTNLGITAPRQAPPGHADTRLMAPVPGEFDNLFRQGERPERAEEREARRKTSQYAVMGAVIVGCAVLGLGLSAAIYGGDGDGDDKPSSPVAADSASGAPERSKEPAASPSPKESPSPSASADPDEDEEDDAEKKNHPAYPQAEALDRLLADSNSSRAAVVRSVANIRKCTNLDQAASDLRSAAEQRRTMVARLQSLPVDKLPRNGELTASLIRAWNSSAAADDHYAAWAEQVKNGKKGCQDGRARSTKRAVEGNRASGDATAAKRQASGMWNAIAKDFDLTSRRAEQL